MIKAIRGVKDAVHSQTRGIIYALKNTAAIATKILIPCWNCSFLVREKIKRFCVSQCKKVG
jgi:hypothetical protein